MAIETSGKSGSVAILRSHPRSDSRSSVCESEDLPQQWGSAKTLAPAIHRLLNRLSLDSSALNAIALITGPGSFTGLRVGVATAKAMAYALRIPIVEVDTLDTIAHQNDQEPRLLHVILDAYRGQLFYASYLAKGPGSIEKLTHTMIVDMEKLVESISDAASLSDQIHFYGSGCSRLQKLIHDQDAFGGRDMRSISSRFAWNATGRSIPQAETVARLGHQQLVLGKTLDPMAVMPHYYRASAAEETIAASRGALGLG